MLDLKERVEVEVKGKDKGKAIVELSKESYMIVSMKHD
jgi:hypothetical protein